MCLGMAMTSYRKIEPMVGELADILDPPERISVAECAEKYRQVNNKGAYVGPWQNRKVPYLTEIMETLTSRHFGAVCFVTSAQSAKTEAILNWIGYTARVDGADFLLYEKSQDDAQDFSERRLGRMHDDSPAFGSCLLPGKSADRTFTKFYKNGTMLSLLWPTKNKLAGKPAPRVALTDYDRMPQNVDGEGRPFDLARARTRTFRSFGMTYVESSPSFPIKDAKWRPSKDKPHEAPPCDGIIAIYNAGDRRRFYWPCPCCGEFFQPDDELCEWLPSDDLVERAQSVKMKCPHCAEGLISPDQKSDLLEQGRWVIEGQRLDKHGNLSGTPRRSDIASFYLYGVAAAFNDWEKMFLGLWQAEEERERTGNEETLKSKINIDFGKPYLPKAQTLDRVPDDLMDRAGDYGERVVPEGVRFLVPMVDVQGNRFEVQVHGVGLAPGGDTWDIWLIDRYQINKSKRLDKDGHPFPLSPPSYLEDWDLLTERVLERGYPLADGSGRLMMPKIVGCDSGGREGTTSMAYKYYRRLRKQGKHHRFQLLKGEPRLSAPRQMIRYPDSDRKDRHAEARGEIPVLFLNSNILKDWLNKLLSREIPGGGYIHFPDWFVERKRFVFEELCNESRDDKGLWHNRGSRRNEAWDLLYYLLGMLLKLNCERINWNNPPAFARPWDDNPLVVAPENNTPEPKKPSSLTAMGKELL